MHAQDVQGRRGSGIDTGFSLSVSGHSAAETVLEFADVEQAEGPADVEEVMMEIAAEPDMST